MEIWNSKLKKYQDSAIQSVSLSVVFVENNEFILSMGMGGNLSKWDFRKGLLVNEKTGLFEKIPNKKEPILRKKVYNSVTLGFIKVRVAGHFTPIEIMCFVNHHVFTDLVSTLIIIQSV